jgi:4-hydroxy-tetrahydrodipicolinate reductase
MIRAAIIGVTGRMGRALVRAAPEFPEILAITAAVASTGSTAIGKDAGALADVAPNGVRVVGASDLLAVLTAVDVAIDFSSPQATQSNLAACRAARKPLLIGTTGFPPELSASFRDAAKDIPLLVAPNTSIGVTVLMELVREAARALPAQFDIEITEAHHRMKRDAPSGTALALGRAAAEGRVAGEGRNQSGQGTQSFEGKESTRGGRLRQDGEIGFAVVRGGDLVGEHQVLFAGMGENLTLGHRATDRAIFARGALQAAAWLASRPVGEYFMRDLFSVKSVS